MTKRSRNYLNFFEKLHYNVLENLIYNDYYLNEKLDNHSLIFAAKYGKLKLIKENVNLCDVEIFNEAVKNSHLEIVKYLHENGCPWDHWTYAYAAENGHLEILKYLHANECPWYQQTENSSKALKILVILIINFFYDD